MSAPYSEWETKTGVTHRLVTITEAEHVTDEVLEVAEDVHDGWFSNASKIDWEDFWNRMDGYELKEHDNREIDLGTDGDSAAMRKIQRHIRAIRKMG